ncbi:MAG: 50S ribosomal protein L25 [Anaerolineae bacterium]|nr:50S ribosomal protein L25 [Anaerolineae bacterium]
MERVEITSSLREVTGKKVKRLRKEGLVPLVVYGRTEPINLKGVEFDINRAIARASGQLIALDIEGQKEAKMVLARDVQRDVITGKIVHVDFYEVDMTEKVRVEVQLQFVGEPRLVAIHEATLMQTLTSVEVECLPGDIMQSIEVDVSVLAEIGDSLLVGDLVVPDTVEILTAADEMVVRLNAIVELEEEEGEEEVLFGEVGEVEVIGRGKTEEEEIEE